MVNTGIEGIALAFPGCDLTSWHRVHFKDFGLIAVYLTIDACGKSAQAREPVLSTVTLYNGHGWSPCRSAAFGLLPDQAK